MSVEKPLEYSLDEGAPDLTIGVLNPEAVTIETEDGGAIVIFGSEEDGISNDLLRMSDERAKIPMTGCVSSLNVSVSVGVAVGDKNCGVDVSVGVTLAESNTGVSDGLT
jgi:hypothetical protein